MNQIGCKTVATITAISQRKRAPTGAAGEQEEAKVAMERRTQALLGDRVCNERRTTASKGPLPRPLRLDRSTTLAVLELVLLYLRVYLVREQTEKGDC